MTSTCEMWVRSPGRKMCQIFPPTENTPDSSGITLSQVLDSCRWVELFYMVKHQEENLTKKQGHFKCLNTVQNRVKWPLCVWEYFPFHLGMTNLFSGCYPLFPTAPHFRELHSICVSWQNNMWWSFSSTRVLLRSGWQKKKLIMVLRCRKISVISACVV